MSEAKTQCPLCYNFENHQAGCRIGTLELELNEAKDGFQIQRDNYSKLYEAVIGEDCHVGWPDPVQIATELRSQLTTAQQEIAELKQLLELANSAASGNEKDKDRLDWLSGGGIICANVADRNFAYDANTGGYGQAETLRQAIDSAMKGTK